MAKPNSFCINCGDTLPPTAKFCGSCGTLRQLIDDNSQKPRGKKRSVKQSKKSREEELAEYEEKYLVKTKNTKSKSKPKTKAKRSSYENAERYHRHMERPLGWKSESTTLILSIVIGLFGISGIGQIYVGKIARGVVILIAGLVLTIVGLATIFIGIGVVFLIAYIPLFIWQIIDARYICRHYNDYYEEFGKAPPSNW